MPKDFTGVHEGTYADKAGKGSVPAPARRQSYRGVEDGPNIARPSKAGGKSGNTNHPWPKSTDPEGG